MSILIRALRVIGFILLGVAFMAVPAAIFKLGLLVPIQFMLGLGEEPSPIVSPIGMMIAIGLGYWVFVRFVEKRPATELSFRPILTFWGAVSGIVLMGAPILTLYALGVYRVENVLGIEDFPTIIPVILAAATLEEFIFRALMFVALERAIGWWKALILQSIIFSVLHVFNAGFGASFLAGTMDITAGILIGALWTALYMRWRNIWAVGLHHGVWNLSIAATGLPLSGVDEFISAAPFESTSHGPDWLTGGAAGPEISIISMGITALAALTLLLSVDRKSKQH